MVVRKTKSILAKTVNAQINPNLTKRNDWSNCEKALTNTDKSYASSTYTKKSKKHNHPYVLTAHKFGLNLPSNALIKNIKFYVRMKATGVYSVQTPLCRFDVYGNAYKNKKDENKTINATGWDEGLYYQKLTTKISSSWKTYTYTMNNTETKKAKIKASHVNADIFGVDLLWYNAIFKGDVEAYKNDKDATGHIYVAWVKVVVEYEIPEHKIVYSVPSTKSNPINVPQGSDLYITATYTQSTNANDGIQKLKMTLPYGTDLIGTPKASGDSSFNNSTMEWTVSANGKHTYKLDFRIRGYVKGIDYLNIGNSVVGNYPCYYHISTGLADGYDGLSVLLDKEVHKNHRACAYVTVDGYSNDSTATYYVQSTNHLEVLDWSFVNGSGDVSEESSSSDSITLNVPVDERFDAYLKVCFICDATGSKTLTVTSDDTGHTGSVTFNVLDPYTYHITSDVTDSENLLTLAPNVITFNTNRIASEIETEAVVLPFYADEFDSYMTQSKSTLSMHKWEELDYIGCVPLEHLHFDPKSTYKDKLLDTHYKNKRYMGKQLASDEDITLNVRLHPQQVTTIQGLIDMDKPIPINANHRCFEGDALNHRGWAEIYGITTTETNPHWYKCDIDVKYLTHNLHTRFHIQRGSEKVNTQPVSDLMSETFAIGDSLSDTDFFITDTDGTYMYNEDDELIVDYLDEDDEEVIYNGDESLIEAIEQLGYDVVTPVLNEPIQVIETIDVPVNERNMFSIGNGQHIDIKSVNALGNVSEVVFDWSSTVLSEFKENYVEKVIELLDENNEPVFKYQYNELVFDYDYTDNAPVIDSITANPIAYVRKDGAWIDYTEEVTLNIDVESGDDSDIMYGSRLHFQLDNHKLKVIDEGFNGREWETPVFNLEGQSYHWHTRWTNLNSDGETNDVVCFIGIGVNDTVFDTQFADKYGKLVISPFPVSDKKLLYVREAEEGTIYYYEDDENSEFSYMIEPYYQYHNGTDLVTDSGISIFNLNYGYELVYIQNGLVRLGFDRISDKGRLFLARYDANSNQYIETNTFKFDKYTDVNLKSITDDKIEIQASDSIFTIWRGHPYIMINHPDEDILIDTRFNRVWAEKVGSDDYLEYPAYWNLMNDANMLPSCVGGVKELKSDCADVEEVTVSDKSFVDLTWSNTFDDVTVGSSKTFQLYSIPITVSEEIDLVNHRGAFGEYEVEIKIDNSIPYKMLLTSNTDNMVSGEYATLSSRVSDYANNPIASKSVVFYQYNPLLFYYEGLGGFEVGSWVGANSNITITTDTTGTTLTPTTTTLYNYFTNVEGTGTGTMDYNGDVVIDFDVVSMTLNGGRFQIYDGDVNNTYFEKSLREMGAVSGSHIKITMTNGLVEVFVDDVKQDNVTVQTSFKNPYRIGFRSNTNNGVIKFKNFIIGGY